MLKNLLIFGVGGFAGVIGGAYLGARLYRKYAIERMKKLIPSLAKIVEDIMCEAYMRNLTEDEFRDMVKSDLDFMTLIGKM